MRKHRALPFLIGLAVLASLMILLAFLWCRHRMVPVSYEPSSYEETADILSNPWQGFYQLCGYFLTDENDQLESAIKSHIANSRGDALALVEINLKRYNSGPISDGALDQLDLILSSWSHTDTQLILRFIYDWDGKGPESEPKTIELIQEHMTQVAPYVNQYADHIYIMQGIFVGNWGEMNNSAFLSREHMTTLLTCFADLTDPSIFLSVRTPAQWRAILNADEPPHPFPAFDGSLTSRLGLYNDGMLGSESDTGTYVERSRQEELAFQEYLCQYVPNGGEVIIENPCNDLDRAIADLSQMHVSYLNRAYDPAVLNKWKDTVYTGDDCFNGCSGFDYIRCHLGYRYVLRSSSLQFDTWHDETASLSFTLENVGFASCLKPLELRITLHDLATGETHTYPLSYDLRLLQSGASETYTLDLPVRNIPDGSYALYLSVKDCQTSQPILLANTGLAEYGYPIGQISICAQNQDTNDSPQTR